MRTALAIVALLVVATAPRVAPTVAAQTDLDAFMQQVLARRDENWKKLQQYVLDEREVIALTGPARWSLWNERREYTWFVRDGFFVRSPIKANGATVSEADRRKYEDEYLKRQKEIEQRRGRGTGRPGAVSPAQPSPTDADAPTGTDAILRQARQPEFISSAYFLRFRFEEGKYALAGKEMLDGREVLRVEYYPANLFRGDTRRQGLGDRSARGDQVEAQMRRMMNKVALVTLWVEPSAHQIVKYTFNNVAFDFLPVQWLARVTDVHASMTMGQPFPDVWLPRNVELAASVSLAIGDLDLRYAIDYSDYRRPDVGVRFAVPAGQ
ncbi:MAG: hypothetical protein WBD07_06425 [Vicinamibacterales bacterium]|mgnify:CR=1 FL=1